MSAEKKDEPAQPTPPAPAPPTVEQMLAQIIKTQEEDRKKVDLLAQAIVEINKKVEAKPSQGNPNEGAEAVTALLKILAPKGGSFDEVAKSAEGFAKVADALSRYRNPVLPYSPADRFLMRAGARTVYKMAYEGVKKRTGEEPTDEELDEELGFKEKTGKKGETEHVA